MWLTSKIITEGRSVICKARGLPSRSAWKGMGLCGYHRPPVSTLFSFGFILAIIISIGLFQGVECFGQDRDDSCKLCSQNFEMAKHMLEDESDKQAICDSYYNYQRCIAACSDDSILMKKTIKTHIDNELKKYGCSKHTASHNRRPDRTTRRPVKVVPYMCLYHGKPASRHCSLFGDPHLRTFYGEFQTCKVKGARQLVVNDYLTVMATNDHVEGSVEATAISKLTVIIKGNPECSTPKYQTYQAQNNLLPSTFEDGRTSYGEYDSLELVEVSTGEHVEIHVHYIQTIIVIRQIGRYFSFSIQMPEDLINGTKSDNSQHDPSSDLSLCVRGCPASEQIDYQHYLSQRHPPSYFSSNQKDESIKTKVDQKSFSREEAEKKCRDAKLVDFFFDSCVFDLINTGDSDFTISSLYALRDMVKLHPKSAKELTNRTSLDNYDQPVENSSNLCSVHFQYWILCMVCLLLWSFR